MTPDPYALDRLHDIVEPPAVSWWPPAAGFWLLLALILVWLVVAILLTRMLRRRNAYRREGLARLREIAPGLRSDEGRAEALTQISELLKRTALAGFPREDVAGLSGADWLAFLDRTGGTDFGSGPASVVAIAPYRKGAAEGLSRDQQDAILASARRWIRRHRLTGAP